jgi:hypothetical protein
LRDGRPRAHARHEGVARAVALEHALGKRLERLVVVDHGVAADGDILAGVSTGEPGTLALVPLHLALQVRRDRLTVRFLDGPGEGICDEPGEAHSAAGGNGLGLSDEAGWKTPQGNWLGGATGHAPGITPGIGPSNRARTDWLRVVLDSTRAGASR